jgi:hypothetical protein
MLNIEIPYSEVKGKRIEFEWNNHLLMAWVFIVDGDDVVKIWEFRFEEV